jgi:molybdopterin-containing oxidoreductase family iron-sulfur binding subunit
MKSIQNKDYWRSLNQLAGTPEFKEFLEREFPQGASEFKNSLNRRRFLTLMGASMALAGLTSCRRPVEKIIPYVKAPEEIIPGIPKDYATTMTLGRKSYGLVVETHEGRPTKIEGNEKHSSSRGGTNVFMQATILALYDPDRSQLNLRDGQDSTWAQFMTYWQEMYPILLDNKGAGLAILSESFASPTLFNLKSQFENTFPEANWYSYEPVSDENLRQGIRAATGKDYQPVYRFDRAQVILSLDSDFIGTEDENVIHARGFIDGRRVSSEKDDMNRLYVVESSFSLTGGMADHRLRLASNHMIDFLAALIQELKQNGLHISGTENIKISQPQNHQKWIREIARDLMRNRGSGLLVAGRQQPENVHALVFALNSALRNIGNTVLYRPAGYESFESVSQLSDLVEQLNTGNIESLVIFGGNPVYNAPADLGFESALSRAKNSFHVSQYVDETSQKVTWHLLQTHFLESWSDAQSTDGSLSIVQPMIAPLFDGKSVTEILQFLTTGIYKSGYELVRDTWNGILGTVDFEKKWRRVLHDGVYEDEQFRLQSPAVSTSGLRSIISNNPSTSPLLAPENLEVVFYPSPAVFDGRFSNNGWLQELPDGVTKLVWDNAAIISLQTAKTLGVKNEDLIILSVNETDMALPVWILPGQADDSIAVTLGYGRSAAGRIGNGVGFNVYRLRSSENMWINSGASIRTTSQTYPMANTQDHNSMEGRPLIRESDLQDYRENPSFAQDMVEHPPLISLWDEHRYEEGYQWGMSIDLNACTGCNACTIACQSENNIPIIGKEQVKEGREMHWMRMDRYFHGETDDPEMVFQPVGCQHCENAPCEQVCPVAATVHDDEGLNVMTYNRCIGTRYCSNNCPYKVRRFNFFNYTKDLPEIVQMAQNPDVTVRSRGVMEKCTYCLQRINESKINAKNQDKQVADGDVVTACQQACPTGAIVFGNLNDENSSVVKMKKQNRDYAMLAELNIKPRTSYLAKLRNPNPELEET